MRADEEVQALSHGNQQRVQLAAALVFTPQMLILDEPFAGLDPVAVDVRGAVLCEQDEAGIAVLFSSHLLQHVPGWLSAVDDQAGGHHPACIA